MRRVRGEHRGLRFRLNGITPPERIRGLCSFPAARGVEREQVPRGALPAIAAAADPAARDAIMLPKRRRLTHPCPARRPARA